MKITKTLLTAAVLVTLGSSVMAANTNQVLGDLNKATGENNIVFGNSNDVAGYSSVTIGNNIYSHARPYNEEGTSGTYSFSPKDKGNIAIGDHAKVDVAAGTAIGYLAQSWGDASVAIGAYSMAFDNVHKVDSKYAGVKTNQGVFSIGSSYPTIYDRGTTPPDKFKVFTRQLQNVGAGAISATSTDAVNGSQLYDAMNEAKKHATVVAGDNVEVTTDTNANGGVEYTVATKKDMDLNSASFGSVSDATHNTITKEGMGVFNGDVDTQYKASGMVVENRDNLDNATHDINGVAADSNGRHIAFTTTNIDAGNQQVHGVKAGESDTDAVNVSQLNKLGSQVNINTQDIADLKGKIGGTANILNESKSYTDQRIAKAGAANAALSGLKYLDYDANHKFVAAASFGQYKGATSGAIGIAYQPNEDVLVHLGTTIGSDHMVNGGVSVRIGDSNKGVKANTKNLAKEMDMIKAENAELKAELAEIKAMLASK